MIEINRNPIARELYWFGLLQFPFFLLIGWQIYHRTGAVAIPVSIMLVSAVLAITGSVVPARLKPVYVGWMIGIYPIGWLSSRMLLASIFYMVVTPVGLALRCFGYDPMYRRFDRTAQTYWVTRPETPTTRRYFRQF